MRKRLAAVVAAACVAGIALGVTLAPAQNSGKEERVLFGVLDGSNEVGPDNRKGAGDPNGRGTASAVIDGRQLCWGITVKNVDTPVAAHIHRGRSNRNGPVVVTLAAPEQGDPGASSGCAEISSSLARELKSNPNRFYWNVHTEDFPGGALRDQVFARRN